MAKPQLTKSDTIRFETPEGTKKLYDEVAALEGMKPRQWYREALRRVALEVLEEHGVKRKLPLIHLPRPKRLQPRIKIRPEILNQSNED